LSRNFSLKNLLAGGKPVFGTMVVQVRTAAVMQIFASAGLDFVVIDMEHGVYNSETTADLVQVARLNGLAPLVRVGELRYHLYSLALDMGALGVISPRIEHPEQVRSIQRSIKYPPAGERGFSRLATHALLTDQDYRSYTQWANDELANIIMIESQTAVEHADELLSEPGIDGVIIGIDDLALSMGLPGDTGNKKVEEAMTHVFQTCKQKGIPWGFHALEASRMQGWLEQGMQLFLFSSDVSMMEHSLRQGLEILRPRKRS
jgi:2-keto-3-deoxy-L-rhamnonate aldolase RhmA